MSKRTDNPKIMIEEAAKITLAEYEKILAAIPPKKRRMFREGSWPGIATKEGPRNWTRRRG